MGCEHCGKALKAAMVKRGRTACAACRSIARTGKARYEAKADGGERRADAAAAMATRLGVERPAGVDAFIAFRASVNSKRTSFAFGRDGVSRPESIALTEARRDGVRVERPRGIDAHTLAAMGMNGADGGWGVQRSAGNPPRVRAITEARRVGVRIATTGYQHRPDDCHCDTP